MDKYFFNVIMIINEETENFLLYKSYPYDLRIDTSHNNTYRNEEIELDGILRQWLYKNGILPEFKEFMKDEGISIDYRYKITETNVAEFFYEKYPHYLIMSVQDSINIGTVVEHE